MSAGLVQAAYIVAALFFIMSLAGLSKQESARNGNYYGIAGMTIALIATIFSPDAQGFGWIIIAMAIGGAIGIFYAKKVEMTEMPELVAILHSFVGLAAVLVGYNSYLDAPEAATHAEHVIHLVEVFLGVFIGAVTFTGSIVAFGKLRGVISSSPLNLPHKHKMNLAAVVILKSMREQSGVICRQPIPTKNVRLRRRFDQFWKPLCVLRIPSIFCRERFSVPSSDCATSE